MPAFEVPVIVSPSTVTTNFNVSFMGVVTSCNHVSWSPSALRAVALAHLPNPCSPLTTSRPTT